MDYKQIISKALEEENWDEVIKYATEAKEGSKYFLNIKPGYINIIKNDWRIGDALKEIGITIYSVYDKADVSKLIKEKKLDDIKTKPILIEASRSTALAKLSTLGLPLQTIKVSERNVVKKDKDGDVLSEHTVITVCNVNTEEKVKFKLQKGNYHLEKGVIKAYLRDKNIESIFED